jgi:hypothetical protein
MRIHSSHDVRLFLHVQSDPILEDCDNLAVAPYAYAYPDVAAHMKAQWR